MKDPVMIDLVGTETNQIPEGIKNIAVVTSGAEKRQARDPEGVLAQKY